MKFKYKEIKTSEGIRYFPITPDKTFNDWNVNGYTSPDKISKGYFAYRKWVEKLDKITLEEMPIFN